MAINFKKGNIFNTKAQTIVNTVNCVGVMGKGIALVYKLRYPNMFEIYKEHCKKGELDIGKLWLYKGGSDAPWVLNFPTKYHWKYPSKLEYIIDGLEKFSKSYKEQGITSIAFPLLGAHNGGLDRNKVLEVMTEHLSKCDIDIEVFEYDPNVADDLFELFSKNWSMLNSNQLKMETGIRKDKIERITELLESGKIKSMIGLINEKGIGIRTLEKCFQFVIQNKNIQPSLFD